jgi:hypothetical protein
MISDVRLIGKRVIDSLPKVRQRRLLHRALDGAASISDGLAAFTERWGQGEDCEDSPIFILSAGWRSGSALTHRLVTSSGRAFLWGEPYHECAYVQRMADSVRAFGNALPADGVFHHPHVNGNGSANGNGKGLPLSDGRMDYVFPAAGHLLAAHRAFFDRLLREPALEGGYDRWGFRAVRLSIEHARYLRWLYPNAKLLLQIRNPYKAYRAYRRTRGLHGRWPHQPVLTAEDFGAFWLDLAGGFAREHDGVNARLVRFEALAASEGTLLQELSEYLDVPIHRDELQSTLREERWPIQAIPAGELELLRRAVEPLASELGYEPTRG